MARPKGSRSADYERRRDELLAKVAGFLNSIHPSRPSFREIAAACEVSQPTLRHYFGGRDGLITAHLERYGKQGAPYIAGLAVTELPFNASLREITHTVLDGFTMPFVGTAQAVALCEGLADGSTGPEYLSHVLEPILGAIAARLCLHIARGEMRECDPRFVATLLVSPIIIASLHQDHLGGQACYPLDLPGLADEAARAVMRSYATAPIGEAAKSP